MTETPQVMVRYTERTPTMCTCPVREQTVNGVTYEIPVEHEPTGPCPAHDQ